MPIQTFSISRAPESRPFSCDVIRRLLREHYRETEVAVREVAGWHEGYRDGLEQRNNVNAEIEHLRAEVADLKKALAGKGK